MSKYLVTGGAGFIGSHLVEALQAAGHDVAVLDNLSTGKTRNLPAGARLYIGDVADPKEVEYAIAGAEGVFHLAAVASVQKSVQDWAGTHRTNLGGTVAVLNAARAKRLPVVYASSAAVYGNNVNIPLAESAETKPLTAYGADKLGSEQHALVGRQAFGIPTMGLRFFNIYGPRQDPHSPYSGVISIFTTKVAAGHPIRIYGDGKQTRDFVYVSDVVRAMQRAMTMLETNGADTPAVLNVCTGHQTSVQSLAEAVMNAWGVKVPLEFGEMRVGDIRFSVGDDRRVREVLQLGGWVTLSEGLKHLHAAASA